MFGRIPILTYHSTLGTIHDQSASGWNPNQTISHSSFSAQLGLLRKEGGPSRVTSTTKPEHLWQFAWPAGISPDARRQLRPGPRTMRRTDLHRLNPGMFACRRPRANGPERDWLCILQEDITPPISSD